MPRASRGRANDVGISHSKKSPLIATSVCTYVHKFVIKHEEGLHRNTS